MDVKGNSGQGNFNQTVRMCRPLALRRSSTLRPALVAMRERKPCLRWRLILLGWYVRLMASSGSMPTDADDDDGSKSRSGAAAGNPLAVGAAPTSHGRGSDGGAAANDDSDDDDDDDDDANDANEALLLGAAKARRWLTRANTETKTTTTMRKKEPLSTQRPSHFCCDFFF